MADNGVGLRRRVSLGYWEWDAFDRYGPRHGTAWEKMGWGDNSVLVFRLLFFEEEPHSFSCLFLAGLPAFVPPPLMDGLYAQPLY
jgi:hypothetical protein